MFENGDFSPIYGSIKAVQHEVIHMLSTVVHSHTHAHINGALVHADGETGLC